MEHYDPTVARRVWQRVRGQQETPSYFRVLANEERQNAETLVQISRRLKGPAANTLRQLAQKEYAHYRFLLSLDET